MKQTVVLLLILATCVLAPPIHAEQQSFESADDLIAAIVALESGPCDLSCHRTLARLLSNGYARARRVAAMYGMDNDEIRTNNTRILFGEELSLDELNAMSDVDFIARQTWHAERSAPPDLILRTQKIQSREALDSDNVRFILERRNAISPNEFEEGVVVVTRTENGWRVTQ